MELDSPAVRDAVQSLAHHALPAFGLGLAAVVAMACLLGALLRRHGRRPEGSRFTPLAWLAGWLALGFAVVVGAALVFAEIAENLADGRQLGALDLLFSDTLRATVPLAALRVFAVLTHLGDTATLTGLGIVGAGVLLRLRQRALCAGWALALAGNAVLNRTLKGIFERTRPVHEHGLAFADGWSFPSGHSSGSLVAYGMLAYLLLRLLPARHAAARLPIVALAAALAFTAGCSRVFLQVHFASDVLAGFASGAAWLTVCIGALELARWRRRAP